MQGDQGKGKGRRGPSELSLIDQVCDRFEAAWGGGDEPKIEEFLQQVPAALRQQLREELEAIAAERRLGRAERPTVEQFIARLVRTGLVSRAEIEAFQEGLAPGQRPRDAKALAGRLVRAGKLTRYQAAAVYQGKTKGLVLGDYVIQDRIGAGGMGQVFRAWHRRMDRVVALKVLAWVLPRRWSGSSARCVRRPG